MKRMMSAAVAAAALVTAVSACSTTSTAAGGGSGASDGSAIKIGPGVTDQEISVAAIAPLTGPVAALAINGVAGEQAFWDLQNAKGGVCGRQVRLVTKDGTYSTQGAMTQYAALHDQVAAVNSLTPGDSAVALQNQIKRDSMVVVAGTFADSILQVPTVMMPGTPYGIEAINGISHLLDTGKLKSGDTLGVIAYPNSLGEGVTAGATAAADKFGLKLVKQQIEPTATDATAQVNALRQAGSKAIVMGTAGTQVVSAASVAEASGYDVMITASYMLSPTDVKGPAGNALVKRVILGSSSAPVSTDIPAMKELRAVWDKNNPGKEIDVAAANGYVMALVLNAVLEKACANGDLSHEGIAAALQQVSEVPSDGMAVALDYSNPGQPPSRESFISKPDPSAPGGATLIDGPKASAFAQEWADR